MPADRYQDLRAWQRAIELVERVYAVTSRLPQEEMFGLKSQLRRCAVSIPSNIAEGNSRESRRDYLRFLEIAKGSLFELQTQNDIAARLEFISKETYGRLSEVCLEIERMLSAMVRKLKTPEGSAE